MWNRYEYIQHLPEQPTATTGMSGDALAAQGFMDLTGIDVSATSVERCAGKGTYKDVQV